MVAAGDGAYDGAFGDGWLGERGVHGGFVASVMLRSMREAVDDPARVPVSLTATYLEPPQGPAPFRVEVSLERRGRSLSVATSRLLQAGRPMVVASAAFSLPGPGPEYSDALMPDVPPPGECPELRLSELFDGWGSLPISRRFEWRLAAGRPLARGDADLAGWVRSRRPEAVDHLYGAVLADVWIPAVLGRLSEPVMTPTVQLSVWYCAPPPLTRADDGYVLCRVRAPVAAAGFFEEDGEIWSPDGRLLVRSRQLAVLRPLPRTDPAGGV